MANLKSILLVEDDPVVGRAVERAMTRAGLRVEHVRSCLAARALRGPFDCAVMDIDLPDGNGVDLSADLSADGVAHSTLFFTGSSDHELLARARGIGPIVRKAEGTALLIDLLMAEQIDPPRSQLKPKGPTQPVSSSRR